MLMIMHMLSVFPGPISLVLVGIAPILFLHK